jgi:hypothetical protein
MLTIDKDGNRFWRNEKDKPHRIGGPAVEWCNCTKGWFVNGELHRIDGPAIEWNNGTKEWYINGSYYTEKEHKEKVKEYVKDR